MSWIVWSALGVIGVFTVTALMIGSYLAGHYHGWQDRKRADVLKAELQRLQQ